jgi:ABC-2 type transport system ATP-binding protein
VSDAVLQLDDVAVRYGKRLALDGLTAEVSGGAIGLLGPNGAGKSTLIKALLGLVPLARGTARVLDADARKDPRRLRRVIGYMPERDAAFPHLTGFQATWYAGRLAGMPDADARRRAHEVLLFAGLEEERYRDVATFSTGMKQRVKLAQALVHDPDLLFLDEPTNGLDPKGRDEMLGLIDTLSGKKGIHVILSSHLLKDVEQVCSSVIVLRGGKLVSQGAVDTLRLSSEAALLVTVADAKDAFAKACAGRGLTVEALKRGGLRLRFAGEVDAAVVFAAAAEAGTHVASLRPDRVSLEDAVLAAMDGSEAGDA